MKTPFDWARRQLELDRELTRRIDGLESRKRSRQLENAHGFLRGTAALFYEILAERPELDAGPGDEGQIVGDMHLENVGAYRSDDGDVVFDLNDFDDTRVGPLRLDLSRLSTSVLLAARGATASAVEAEKLLSPLLDAHQAALLSDGAPPSLPALASERIERARRRTRKELLDARAPLSGGQRRFVRGARYVDLPPELGAGVPELWRSYVTALGERAPEHASRWELVDSAQRVAGTGSLGCYRVALLTRDRHGVERLYELKEARASALDRLLGPGAGDQAERVVSGTRALLPRPMRQLAALAPGQAASFVGRRLNPNDDKLDLTGFPPGQKLSGLVTLVGHLLGRAHRRALVSPAPRAWSADELDALVDRAIELAGLHEAIYLAYARLAKQHG
jgi:uncharacterized protein (DUF2252 family)